MAAVHTIEIANRKYARRERFADGRIMIAAKNFHACA
jgi:hypothetical protein